MFDPAFFSQYRIGILKTVGSNESAETEAIVDVTAEEFEQDGSIDFDWGAQAV